MSHLLQMRGLKPTEINLCSLQNLSHLLQMRGLKPTEKPKETLLFRRIFYRCVD